MRTLLLAAVTASLAVAQGTRQAGFFSFHDDACTAFVLDHDAKHTLTGFGSGAICVFPTDQMSVHVIGYGGHKKAITSAVFLRDKGLFATSSSDGTIKFWKLEDARKHHKAMEDSFGRAKNVPLPKPILSITAHVNGVAAIALSGDGKRIASGGADGNVKIWDAANGKLVANLPAAHVGGTRSVCYSPDGKLLASGGADASVKLWDLAADKPALKTALESRDGPVHAVAISPDGKQLAAGVGVPKKSGAVLVFDLEAAKLAFKLTGHEDVVTCVIYHPKTAHVASGGADKKIRVWSLAERQEQYVDEHGEPISALNISFDGARFGSASARTARWWRGMGK